MSLIKSWLTLLLIFSFTFEDPKRGAATLDRILSSKVLVHNVGNVGKLGLWWQQKSFHWGVYDTSRSSTSVTLLISPTTLPFARPAGQGHPRSSSRHVSVSGPLYLLILAWTLPPHIQGLFLVLSSLNSNFTEAFLDTSLYYTTQQDTSYSPSWFSARAPYCITWPEDRVFVCYTVSSTWNVNSKAEILIVSFTAFSPAPSRYSVNIGWGSEWTDLGERYCSVAGFIKEMVTRIYDTNNNNQRKYTYMWY